MNKQMFRHLMFQIPDNPLEQRYYLVRTFLVFGQMLKIYIDFMKVVTAGFDTAAWSTGVDSVCNSIQKVSDAVGSKL